MDDSPSLDGSSDKESVSELDSLYDAIKEHDDIRFATYRTAAKVRYVQRRGYLHHIDIWNVIEAFRENGLNTMEATTLVNRARLETLLSSIYNNLNKRLPPGQSVNVDKTSSLMATWLLFSLCPDNTNRLKVFWIKICLAVLSCGKLMDKLRYIFSQLTDSNGQLIFMRFSSFITEVCKLPAAVGEGRTFSVTESNAEVIFPDDAKVNVNDFLETMMSDPGPHCVSWLLVLHRISGAEGNYHPVACAGCHREGFNGLRYKSDSAPYHLCQLCFWRGEMSEEHRDDVFKEYSAWKTPGKPSGLRRSIRCVAPPGAVSQRLPRFPDKPEETLDLANIIPASPLPTHNGFNQSQSNNGLHSRASHTGPNGPPNGPTSSNNGHTPSRIISGIDKLAITRLHGSSPLPVRRSSQFNQPTHQFNQPIQFNQQNNQFNQPTHQFNQPNNQFTQPTNQFIQPLNQFNQFATLPQPSLSSHYDKSSQRRGKGDEHELIAHYASHLADTSSLDYLGLATGVGRPESSPEEDPQYTQRRERGQEKDSRRLVYELEKKNKEIMNEIARLRQNRASVQDMEKDPNVVTELEVLRQRRHDLETRLSDLQETRKDLMVELEELMKLLRSQGNTQPPCQPGGTGGLAGGGPRQDDILRGKSYQACKFSQVSKHENVSAKLRAPSSSSHPIYGDGRRDCSRDRNGGDRRRDRSGGDGRRDLHGGVDRELVSSPESASIPASVNSLSE